MKKIFFNKKNLKEFKKMGEKKMRKEEEDLAEGLLHWKELNQNPHKLFLLNCACQV